MRLAVRKVKGPAASARKNRPVKKSLRNEGIVVRGFGQRLAIKREFDVTLCMRHLDAFVLESV
jgi:hypothetical protein